MRERVANCEIYYYPLWARHDRTIWTQDECAPDAETGDEAWQRLFGEPFDQGHAIDHVDLGDMDGWLMPNGYVFWSTYCGDQISRAVVIEVVG